MHCKALAYALAVSIVKLNYIHVTGVMWLVALVLHMHSAYDVRQCPDVLLRGHSANGSYVCFHAVMLDII